MFWLGALGVLGGDLQGFPNGRRLTDDVIDIAVQSILLATKLAAKGGRAFVSINKALVTQASSAIPVVPLYFAKSRPVVERDGLKIMVDDDRLPLKDGEKSKCARS